MFQADELRTIIEATDVPLPAMVLLAINYGFGQSVVSNLPIRVIDLQQGWVEFPRPKTGIERRCALWSETVKAIRLAIAQRSTPSSPDNNGLAFITPCGEQ
jgi:integrase